mmetsp:Transcript_140418/g.350052  ORF Transcript_140418/g.350052 Transcript_140418/m.350052 type:complete len:214 (-) Transcript_140418:143-784(-)
MSKLRSSQAAEAWWRDASRPQAGPTPSPLRMARRPHCSSLSALVRRSVVIQANRCTAISPCAPRSCHLPPTASVSTARLQPRARSLWRLSICRCAARAVPTLTVIHSVSRCQLTLDPVLVRRRVRIAVSTNAKPVDPHQNSPHARPFSASLFPQARPFSALVLPTPLTAASFASRRPSIHAPLARRRTRGGQYWGLLEAIARLVPLSNSARPA